MPRPDRPERDQAYVEDILDSAKAIATYLAGATFEGFGSTPMLLDAVIRRLSIIGEAASNLSQVFKTAYPGAKWRDIIGLRNLVVHRYWTIDLEKIWNIANYDVPELAGYLSEQLAPRDGG